MRPCSADIELYELCTASTELVEAMSRAFQRERCSLPPGELARELAGTHQALREMRGGDWAPLEQHLEELGNRHGRAGIPVSA